MNKLNEQYFKIRNQHKKNVHPKVWTSWVVTALVFLLLVIYEIRKQIALGESKNETADFGDEFREADSY